VSPTHWKLVLSYDGSHFHGWQVQPGLTTVQGVLADALKTVAGEDVLPQGSGRTDAGVHALAQVASVSLDAAIPAGNLHRALNRVLPAAVRVTALQAVPPGFHARHSAERKTYEYRVFERRFAAGEDKPAERICSPFLAPYVWDCRWPLALDRMQTAAVLFCGTHDFTSFAAGDPDRGLREEGGLTSSSRPNPVKTIWHSAWSREDGLLVYRVTGSGFLHHMVRNMVGTLIDVGRGSFDPEDISRILAARDRTVAGPTAPARGLFLRSVEYPVGSDTLPEPPQ
jgi:tRNA pseudouridine38-40 synthase